MNTRIVTTEKNLHKTILWLICLLIPLTVYPGLVLSQQWEHLLPQHTEYGSIAATLDGDLMFLQSAVLWQSFNHGESWEQCVYDPC